MPQVQTLPQQSIVTNFSGLDAILRMQFDVPAQKRKKEYGHKISKTMWAYVTDSNVGYYSGRYRKWKENQNWLKGEIDDREFRSYMGVEGNKTWLNMDYTVIKILTRYEKSIINRFMDREEKPSVRATDVLSQRFKEREKILASYRMKNNKRIKDMESVLPPGQKLETGFVPEDEDELDIYYKVQYRMPEEAFMQSAVWQVFQHSDYEYFKRTVIKDGIRTNLFVTKLEEQPYTTGKTLAERLKVRRCDPQNTIYNIFKNSNGSDISIIGEARTCKISDGRRKYPKISEMDWFRIAQVAGKGLDQSEPLNWQDIYTYALSRPYDDYSFIEFDFEVKVYDAEYAVEQKASDGTDIIIEKKGRPKDLGPDKTMIESGRFNMYAGTYAPTADIMLKWEVLPNQIRPFQNGVDVFSNYSVQYPDADGFYVPSLAERGIPPARQLMLIALKIQQMVSTMEPDNEYIDVSGLRQLEIGTGEKLKPMQLAKLKAQTGKGFWDSTDDAGVALGQERKAPWTREQAGYNVAQINALIPLYNFWLQRLNDEWGENQETLGQPTAAKKSAKATEIASINGQSGVEYIYDAFIAICEQNATKIVYRLWDMLVLEAGNYKQAAGIDRDLLNATFDTNIDFFDKRGRKERLTARIDRALQEGIISMSMAERLDDIDDPKDAILYLEKLEKQQAKAAQTKQEREIALNARVQENSTKIASEGKAQVEMSKAQAKIIVEHLKANDTAYNDMVKFVNDAEKEAIKAGIELPQDVKLLKQYLTQSVITKNAARDQQQEQPAEQQ